jgi:hypothetical protein
MHRNLLRYSWIFSISRGLDRISSLQAFLVNWLQVVVVMQLLLGFLSSSFLATSIEQSNRRGIQEDFNIGSWIMVLPENGWR